MKKVMAVLLALVLLAIPAGAEEIFEGLGDFAAYQEALVLPEEVVWTEDGALMQSVEIEEGLMLSVCLRDTQIAVLTVEYPLDMQGETVLEALRLLGMDEETLAQVSVMEANTEIAANGVVIGRVCGETREAVYVCLEAERGEMLWLPVHGGDQVHDLPRCSGMDVSRMVTPEAAALTQYDNCDTCRADVQETEA